MNQQSLFNGSMRSLVDGTRAAINEYEQRFIDTHRKHPAIYNYFCQFARELLQAGRTRASSKMIVERIRWETMLRPTDEGVPEVVAPLKINNNMTAYLARLWQEDHPQHPDFFATRKVNGE
jgi:hypothetical protein